MATTAPDPTASAAPSPTDAPGPGLVLSAPWVGAASLAVALIAAIALARTVRRPGRRR